MRPSLLLGFLAASSVLGIGLAACSSSETCADQPGGCFASGVDGGPNSDSGDADSSVPIPEGCDADAEPKDAPKCVVNEFGVFVDGASGNDSGAGTKEAPFKTIGGALAKLAGRQRIYVCEGTYAEKVKVTSAVSIYGGWGCGAWTYTGAKAKVAPADSGYALHVENVAAPVVFSDLELIAKDGVGAGASSIAVFLSKASKVGFKRDSVTAGNGQAGTDGASPADFAPASAPAGNDGASPGNGEAKPNPACNTSIGGKGGRTGEPNGIGGVVAIAPPFPGTTYSGAGGNFTLNNCNGGSSGDNGSFGTAGPAGVGATSFGMIDAAGWKGSDGTAGGEGGDGQGGGGGARLNGGGVGGSGGPGGCGGSGGPGGTAGGSSIALVSFDSAVTLDASALVAANGGRGGNGATGQKAQQGGNEGSRNVGGEACSGGLGGHGGSGGGGGGGAGGLSAGIAFKGTPPLLDGTPASTLDTHAVVTVGTAGAAGTKGNGGVPAKADGTASRAGADGTDGKPGEAKAVFAIP